MIIDNGYTGIETWTDKQDVRRSDGEAVTIWRYAPIDHHSNRDNLNTGQNLLFSGSSPANGAKLVDVLIQYGHVITTAGRPSWNHRVAGVGIHHNDAEFAELGHSGAAYNENHERWDGTTWWTNQDIARKYGLNLENPAYWNPWSRPAEAD